MLHETIRALALALPEVVEQDHHGFPSFRVRGRIFATLPDGAHLHLMLPEEAARAEVAFDPERCALFWWGQKVGALRVRLGGAEVEALHRLLVMAWRAKAPRGLLARQPPG